ncbi:FAD-dependent oxidoreductase [bacterium]|nr:MAG: FAD-dependent oxidoreductase [bacterium]
MRVGVPPRRPPAAGLPPAGRRVQGARARERRRVPLRPALSGRAVRAGGVLSGGRRRVAVVGGGIAGLTAGYYLSRTHDVVLFEKSGRLGGNAYSHRLPDGTVVDIAVAAFGKAGYKNFYALLGELDIPTVLGRKSYISCHDLDSKTGLYLTLSARGALSQGLDLVNPANLQSLANLFLGLRRAQRRRASGALKGVTLGRLLQELPEFSGDTKVIFLSALCLLSSMAASEVLDSPAEFFLNKLKTHHDMLSPKALYSVRCVRDGTRRYVNALAARFRKDVVFHARIKTVGRGSSGAVLVMEDGSRQVFDAVVFACNPDQALALLAAPTPLETELLGAWRYKDGRVVVHRDLSSFPPRPLIEAYTFLYTMRDGVMDTSVNGATWHLPHVPDDCEYISAQHPNYPIRRDLIDLDTVLRTPMFDFRSLATVPRLAELNEQGQSYYCGSYFGFGLHEDAVTSAKAVAAKFGCV